MWTHREKKNLRYRNHFLNINQRTGHHTPPSQLCTPILKYLKAAKVPCAGLRAGWRHRRDRAVRATTSVSTCQTMSVSLVRIQNNRKLRSLQKVMSLSAALFMVASSGKQPN